jgi:hypothetical protein
MSKVTVWIFSPTKPQNLKLRKGNDV